MIKKVSELLEIFIAEESKKLETFDMPHMPTLGEAYEELTKKAIDQEYVLPKSLDLRVISGFISIRGDMLPEQIDCMLVHGEGVRYGFTDKFIYEIDNVLCIFEVKKSLRKGDFVDAFDHLRGIRRKYAEYFESKLVDEDFEPDLRAARKHFSQITGKIAPEKYSGMHSLPFPDAVLFYSLVQESLAPLSIIQGYQGYKTEAGLRNAFLDVISDKSTESREGLGIPSIPSLVTSNNFSLIKATGVPFICIKDRDDWVAVISSRFNPAKLILELLWSKISLYFNASMPWEEGLYMENVQPLLTAKFVRKGSEQGWMYKTIELNETELSREDENNWEPAFIGEAEVSALYVMAALGHIPINEGMDEMLKNDDKSSISRVVENLIETRVFMRDGAIIRPINDYTQILVNEDGTGYVSAETERFTFWCESKGVEPNFMNLIYTG